MAISVLSINLSSPVLFSHPVRAFGEFVVPRGRYQPHIDGLRALAVLVVLAFHFFPSRFPGGFIGVDVFFVISGYLITGILYESLRKHSFGFALKRFYQRRIRRIFPAVGIVLGALLIVGWFVLFAEEYRTLAKHIAAGAGFIQNILLWSESGYFDTDAIQKPLLHFWSLAVEEQFYIFWPFGLWLIMRKEWPLLWSIAIIIVISFVANMWSVYAGHASAAFYLPHTRTWELMIGAWLAVAQKRDVLWIQRYSIWQSWIGLVLVLVGFAVIRSEDFPGAWAIIPVMGSALIINAGHRGFLNVRIASWKPAVWVGLISYPLYLVHWVLLTLANKFFYPVVPRTKLITIGVSFLFAWMIYEFVESKLRRGKKDTTLALLSMMAVIGAAAMYIRTTNVAEHRWGTLVSPQMESYTESIRRSTKNTYCSNLLAGRARTKGSWYCILGDETASTAIGFFGDSHAEDFVDVIDLYGKNNKVKIIYSTVSGCLALHGIEQKLARRWSDCYGLAEQMEELAVEDNMVAVMQVQAWPSYIDYINKGEIRVKIDDETLRNDVSSFDKPLDLISFALRNSASRYRDGNIKYIILEDHPYQKKNLLDNLTSLRFMKSIDDAEINRNSITLDDYFIQQGETNNMLKSVTFDFANSSVLEIGSALCDASNCPWTKDGRFIYYDASHFSVYGAGLLYPILKEKLNKIVAVDDVLKR